MFKILVNILATHKILAHFVTYELVFDEGFTLYVATYKILKEQKIIANFV